MFNFNNIGDKIKTLAVVVSIIGIIGSVIGGLFLLEYDTLTGLLTAFLGSVLSWVSAFFVYGFGELIVKTTEIAKNTKQGVTIEIDNKNEKN